jgi:hypothetical protein
LGLQLNHQGSRLIHHNLCCSPSYTTKALECYTEAPKCYTTMASETTQIRMLPQPTTPRLQLIHNQSCRILHWNAQVRQKSVKLASPTPNMAAPKFRINFASNSGTTKSEDEFFIIVILWNEHERTRT